MGHPNEAAKYAAVWSHDAYRQVAPGEHHVEQFLRLARPRSGDVLCDFGCGTGRAALKIASLTDLSVVGVDFAGNSLDAEVRSRLGERFRFLQHDLTAPLKETYDFGYCTDVLEHIPPQDVDRVLQNIFLAARKVYLAISTQPDVMGALIGEPLHLTVRSPYWWHSKLRRMGIRIDWSWCDEHTVCFYGSGYANAQDVSERSLLNVDEERVKQNILTNLRAGYQEISPHQVQDTHIILLAGGPSLNDHADEIVEAAKSGAPIVTVNGTYSWCLERGLNPGAQFVIDAREFNKRFVEPTISSCKYILGSQCDPSVVQNVPRDQVWMYHSGDSEITQEAFREYCSGSENTKEWFPIYGGTTVLTRALTVLLMLGFRKIEVFGWDSCLRDSDHHAYTQPENDSDIVLEVTCGGRKFKCHPWMLAQAGEVSELIRNLYSNFEDFDLCVRGDGLIAHIINHAAELAMEKENGC